MSKNNKVVLAYSGGLDTSYCVKYLKHERNLEVHTIIINTGGFTSNDLESIEKKAYELGSHQHIAKDVEQLYYDRFIKHLIAGNILKNNTYPLSVSAERVLQAIEVVAYAKQIGASYIAHGSTGAGNDQVRFDVIFNTLAPDINIITPIRDQSISREEEVAFLEQHGVSYTWQKAQYSINKGLWGTSVGGKETLTSSEPLPESAFPSQLTENEPKKITLSFDQGNPVALNGKTFNTPIDVIKELETIASAYAIGRDMHVGDTIIGMKGRVGFEAAAPLIIIKAHSLLEKHILGKWQQYWKKQIGEFYGMLLHEGHYFDPVMRDMEAFLAHSQGNVTGDVFITLKPYHYHLDGIESSYDLMKADFGSYGEKNTLWNAEEAKGFIKIYGAANKMHHLVNAKK